MEVEIKHYDKRANSIIYVSSERFKGAFHSFDFGMWNASTLPIFKSLRQRRNGCQFADDILKFIFLYARWEIWI